MNPRVLATLSLLSLSLVAPPAVAQASTSDDSEAQGDRPVQGTGFAFAIRGGFGLPLGNVEGGNGTEPVRMKDVVNGIAPVQLDAGYFLGSSLYLGASFQYGRALLADACPEGTNCSATDLRFGANVSLHLPTSGKWSPWLGVGIGYEFFKPRSESFKGVEFNGQLGADYHLSGPVWAGPFATFTTGKFSNVTEKQSHSWLMGGLRLLMRH
ncbi:hypothetical protein [Hyalangium rubrum]|uniref:Outer membrane protein beta-barrel domain-containing protein n=1 Tax=Hyalangium rubrum TaxID=3103134 RepID=A0ABU5GZD0_9BACT|nr:hypothetical protein [Hyalangium sp. s54d21]MDY7226553.1 hypothetical protein [Hyalangium sp. s54d21]